MSQEICRLCLSDNNLGPLFVDRENCEQYSVVLRLTTGLKIQYTDGLPQKICNNCTELVNSAMNLRNQSNLSELKLKKLGYGRMKIENNISNLSESKRKKLDYEQTKMKNNLISISDKDIAEENHENIDSTSNDCLNYNRLNNFDIEVEFERITENGTIKTLEQAKNNLIQPKSHKMTRKEKKDLYMNMVEGAFNPKGPVKCKVCKKSVSKWSCFISHAKLHIGFTFICEYCGKSFISSTQLKRHCRSHHGMKRELPCKYCNYLALDNAQLLLHERRVHTGERPYVCDSCGSSYYSRRCLLQHLESHRSDASVKCELCNQLFKSRRHLSRHRYSVHSAEQGKGRLRCPVCARVYSRKYLRAHIAHHDRRGDAVSTETLA